MEWIKKGFMLFISRSDKEQEEFERHNSKVVLSRIRLISLATVCLGIFWAYMDWIIIKNGVNQIYGQTLIAGHIVSVLASAIILIFYRRLVNMSGNHNYPVLYLIIKLYVFLYILVGAVSSINSQRYTGNIYSYIILSLIVATALALKPSYMLLAFGVNHLIFLSGIALLNDDMDLFLVKLLNSTVLIIAAFLLGFIFYRHRMVEFLFR